MAATNRDLEPCGSHAAAVRHWRNGEQCDECQTAERLRQRAYYRLRILKKHPGEWMDVDGHLVDELLEHNAEICFDATGPILARWPVS